MAQSLKRVAMDPENAILTGIGKDCQGSHVHLIGPKFTVGRAVNSSYNICHLTVSRLHCLFELDGKAWTACDKSTLGTYLNGLPLEKNKPCVINNGDSIQFGPFSGHTYIYSTEKKLEEEPMCKKLKTQPSMSPGKAQVCQEKKREDLVMCPSAPDGKLKELSSQKKALEAKIKEVQIETTQMEQQKLQQEVSRKKELVELQERHNNEREELWSQSLLLSSDETALEKRLGEEQKALEDKLNKQIEELQVKISHCKDRHKELLEANQKLHEDMQLEQEKFKKRLESEQSSYRHQMEADKEAAEQYLNKRIESLEKKYIAETSKLQDELSNQQKKIQQEKVELQNHIAGEHALANKKLKEEKEQLEKKIKDMQACLVEKERVEEDMRRKLKEKEQQRLQDLKHLQEQQDAETRNLLQEVSSREECMRRALEHEIQSLQEEKMKIEDSIQGERLKIEGDSAENMKRLQEELEKVKRDLTNIRGKKQVLEKELEETNKAKEDASISCLKAREDLLVNFENLMETELQCSVCSELFIMATTLNCSHTFCRHCILEWKKKKKDCPICRTAIKAETRSIVLDNFIDKMVSTLSEDLKKHREAITETRQVSELLSAKPSDKTNRRRDSQSNEVVELDLSRNHTINLSSSNSDSSSSSLSSSTSLNTSSGSDGEEESFAGIDVAGNVSDWNDSASTSSASSIEGTNGDHYGGYGNCFRCGRRGHWSNGCPY